MSIKKATIIKYCFRFGAIFSVLALFLPATHTTSYSSDGFASGLFSGTWYGIETLMFLCFLPPVGLTFASLLVAQIALAFKSTIRYPSFWTYTEGVYILISVVLIICIGNEALTSLRIFGYHNGDKLLLGYYFYSIGTVLTTIGLFIGLKLARAEYRNTVSARKQ